MNNRCQPRSFGAVASDNSVITITPKIWDKLLKMGSRLFETFLEEYKTPRESFVEQGATVSKFRVVDHRLPRLEVRFQHSSILLKSSGADVTVAYEYTSPKIGWWAQYGTATMRYADVAATVGAQMSADGGRPVVTVTCFIKPASISLDLTGGFSNKKELVLSQADEKLKKRCSTGIAAANLFINAGMPFPLKIYNQSAAVKSITITEGGAEARLSLLGLEEPATVFEQFNMPKSHWLNVKISEKSLNTMVGDASDGFVETLFERQIGVALKASCDELCFGSMLMDEEERDFYSLSGQITVTLSLPVSPVVRLQENNGTVVGSILAAFHHYDLKDKETLLLAFEVQLEVSVERVTISGGLLYPFLTDIKADCMVLASNLNRAAEEFESGLNVDAVPDAVRRITAQGKAGFAVPEIKSQLGSIDQIFVNVLRGYIDIYVGSLSVNATALDPIVYPQFKEVLSVVWAASGAPNGFFVSLLLRPKFSCQESCRDTKNAYSH